MTVMAVTIASYSFIWWNSFRHPSSHTRLTLRFSVPFFLYESDSDYLRPLLFGLVPSPILHQNDSSVDVVSSVNWVL